MEERKGKFAAKMGLVDQLGGLLRDLQNLLAQNQNKRSFRELQTKGRDDVVTVTADKNIARTGTHQFEVVNMAQKSSAMTSGFSDPDEDYIGVGYFSYDLPNGETKEVYIDSEHASLSGVARLINGDEENGMTAKVINDGSGSDTPHRLIVSIAGTGDDSQADFPYFYFVDGDYDFYLEQERPAQDAKIKLDGFEIEVPSNKVNDLIPGVTVDLKKAAPGEEFTIQITEDITKITEKIGELVAKVNAVLQFINDQNTIDENTDTSSTLGGDVTLQTLESRLRRVVFRPIETDKGVKRFGDLGISFQKNGMLKLDTAKFESFMNADAENVGQVLNGRFTAEGFKTNGFIDFMTETIDLTLRFPDGLIPSRKRGMQSRIDQIDRRIAQRQRLIEQKEKNLKDKFARLESTMNNIRAQGSGLAALGGSGGSVVQQLG